ncbi:probable carboxylesterase 8 [Telopea speciosissima]|uniref:probable carboxylesterase 8 n=1 Tax=Telopea speciosissima TaxID=54955 RepID=UPI001CC633C6|nr:probable carboxylesterase 8 [Telopea speciosissima]
MAEEPPTPSSIDPYKQLRITLNPDGTLTRVNIFPNSPPTGEESGSDSPDSVLSKDIPLNATTNTWLRLFFPTASSTGRGALPLIICFHGGGFILFSAASRPFHLSCCHMAREFPAVIASVEYRLAPEHRLPAAYDDAVEAIQWVQAQALDRSNGEPWLRDHVDFNSCYLMGSSSGGNIVYQAALRTVGLDLEPVEIQGFILNQPYFGGLERTGSELRLKDDKILSLPSNDLMWELALPVGSDRNHEYCNPMLGRLDRVGEDGLLSLRGKKWLVRGYGGDPLVDRQRVFVEMLEKSGMTVVAWFDETGFHAVELFDPAKAQTLLDHVKEFVYSSGRTIGDSSAVDSKKSAI